MGAAPAALGIGTPVAIGAVVVLGAMAASALATFAPTGVFVEPSRVVALVAPTTDESAREPVAG
jgi:hypothetical protein